MGNSGNLANSVSECPHVATTEGTEAHRAVLAWTVPVRYLHAIPCVAKAFADLLGDHDRAVLSAGTSEGDREVALTFMDVMRDQVDKQIGDA